MRTKYVTINAINITHYTLQVQIDSIFSFFFIFYKDVIEDTTQNLRLHYVTLLEVHVENIELQWRRTQRQRKAAFTCTTFTTPNSFLVNI